MNFKNLFRIHREIDVVYPDYQEALALYKITEDEKRDKKINIDCVDITNRTGYLINGVYVNDTECDNIIWWRNFLVASELCPEPTPTCKSYHEIADKLMYCMYLYAIDDINSRKELYNIFKGEELKSKYFNVECNTNYAGNHVICESGLCECNKL